MKRLQELWLWFNDRSHIAESIKPMLNHLVPPKLGWWYVFGAATLTAFIVQVVTGIFLASMYVTSPDGAYLSIKWISEVAPVGNLIRGIHFFGASAMVIFVFIHLTRVFLMAAYKFPRELNWLTGTVLLLLTLGMGFTGQLLRWDQNAIWSVVVGAEQAGRVPVIGTWLGHVILGGDTLNSTTLQHVFSIHVFLFPTMIAAIIGFHLYLVLRNGISEKPVSGRPVDPKGYRAWYQELLKVKGEPFWPYVAWRDVAVGALVVFGIVALAHFVGPPNVQTPPDPTIIKAEPRPEWYFLWYFAVLALLPHQIESYVMILFPLLVGVVLFSLPLLFRRGERAMRMRPWASLLVLGLLAAMVALTLEGYKSPWSPRFDAKPLTTQVIGASSGPVYQGAQIFNTRGCLYCHQIEGHGGFRGPDLTSVADRLTRQQLIIRIMNGADNMPAFAGILTSSELDSLMSFLETRTLSGESDATFIPGERDSL
jgi:ubiquinol-cytochrome c reductase cytochrome b subunit